MPARRTNNITCLRVGALLTFEVALLQFAWQHLYYTVERCKLGEYSLSFAALFKGPFDAISAVSSSVKKEAKG